jgi:hypothetical protein
MTDNGEGTSEDRAGTTKARRKAGTGFPVVSLAEASNILKEAGRYGFEHSVAEFASYMGHVSTNSGAFRQRLAAFRDWKLIAGRGDQVSMTEIGRIVALPPDEDAERDALRVAFQNCAVFNKLYEEGQKGTPLSRQGLGRRAVHAFGVSPNSVNKFIDSFTESAIAAGLAELAGDGQITLIDSATDTLVIARPADEVPTSAAPGGSMARGTSAGTRSAGIPVVHQTWPIEGGMIMFEIRSERPLPAGAYATVGEVVASLERLSIALSGASTSPEGSVASGVAE